MLLFVTLSIKDNQKLSNNKGFEKISITNVRIKIQQINIDIFLNQTFMSKQIVCFGLFKQ